MIKENKKNHIITTKYKFLLLTLIVLLMSLITVPKTRAAQEDEQRYTINSADALKEYSIAYASGARNPNDILDIAINSGSVISYDGFVSIGTSDRPFSGTLITPSSGIQIFHLFGCPLFDYVTTDMKIQGSGDVKIMREKATDEYDYVLTEGALFANHVVKGESAASWDICLYSLTGEGTEDTSFDCVIKDIASDASVDITFTNTSSLNSSGSGNVGLICGTLGAGASLDVTLAGSGSAITVSGSGDVGGLVGAMGSGANLTLNSANNSKVSSVTSTSGYAGGFVGNAEDPTITFNGVTNYAITSSVNGNRAGGVFGRYYATSNKTFTLNNTFAIQSDLSIEGSDYAGGVFGLLENNAAFTFNGDKTNKTVDVDLNTATYKGGICGAYYAHSLSSNTLTITNTKTSINAVFANYKYIGGLIGGIVTYRAYVAINNCEVVSENNIDGGLIGAVKVQDTFVDVSGNIKLSGSGTFDAGIISTLTSGTNDYRGVLRLQGVTDLGECKFRNESSGQIVKDRNRYLVYALGDGKGVNGNWTLKRGVTLNVSANRYVEDIKSGGNVIRVDGVTLKEEDLFTVNTASHFVRVKPFKSTLSSLTDFAIAAIYLQFYTESNAALKFETSDVTLSNLLKTNFTLSSNINLAGTGISSLLREDGKDIYSGTFNGGNKTITYIIGEMYGLDENGNTLQASSKEGYVSKHTHNALFPYLSGTVENLIINCTANIISYADDLNFSSLAAYATGNVTITNVISTFNVNLAYRSDYVNYFGGLIAQIDSKYCNVTIDSCEVTTTIVENSTSSSNSNKMTLYGGVIAMVNGYTSSNGQHITIVDSNVSLTYSTNNTTRATIFGGLITRVKNGTYNKGYREIVIDSVNIDLDIQGNATSALDAGAMVGYNWDAVDSYISNLVIDASVSINASTAINYGGLFHRISGYMELNSVTLTSANYDISANSSNTFGLVANKGFVYDSDAHNVVYLEVNNQAYNVSALSFETDPLFAGYDEIVYEATYNNVTDPSAGNCCVISIKTPNNIISSVGDTYVNKTTYGQKADLPVNTLCRYYYDVKYAIANKATPKYALYVYSIYTYVHSSCKPWFSGAATSYTGNIDMTGISYYPLIASNIDITFDNCTIKLDNTLMESYVKKLSTTSLSGRTTHSASEHYLMHFAVFKEIKGGTLTIKNTTLQGNVPRINNSNCGFIVLGRIGESESIKTKIKLVNILLDGVYITNLDNTHLTLTDNRYPLLFNRVRKNSDVNIRGLRQSTTAYASYYTEGYYAGSSLIGTIGSTSHSAMNITLSNIVLDGRKNTVSIGNMDTTYGTKRSIFSRAIFADYYQYFNESSATYNFSLSADWDGSTGVHNVTYGAEISSSVEYLNKQKKYSGSDIYVNPTRGDDATGNYDFSTNFLNYVRDGYNSDSSKHEFLINQSYTSSIEGTGKYGDPFIIDESVKMEIITAMMYGLNVGETVDITLPSDLSDFDYTNTSYTTDTYSFGNEELISLTDSITTIDTLDFRTYLAGAYYLVTVDIVLPSSFIAFGENPDYLFNGVIIGDNNGENPVITNHSIKPLVSRTNGCVVKNIDLVVDTASAISLNAPSSTARFYYSNGINTYGSLIAQVFGGDTFIDNVHIEYDSISFLLVEQSSSYYDCLVPIGGYIGTIVNGGVIFRNMTSNDTGLTGSDYEKVTDSGYLYINPIIGRVISGYAFHETNAVHTSESTTTLKNGTKNYSISDLSKSEAKLSVTKNGSIYNVTIPNGQAWYILGAIVNSGAGSATYANSDEQAYKDIVETYNNAPYIFYQGYRADTVTRAGATYDKVGKNNFASYPDYYTYAVNDSNADSLVKIPYIISAYTTKTNNLYYARYVTSAPLIISVTGNCNIPAGFKGIGNIYFADDGLRLKVRSLNGATNSTPYAYEINLDMTFYEYDYFEVNSYHAYVSSNFTKTAGFGLFNYLVTDGASETNSLQNIILSGNVDYDIYTTEGNVITYYLMRYNIDNFDNFASNNIISPTVNTVNYGQHLSTGGLIGYFTGGNIYIKNVTFNDLSVSGAKDAGGLLGCAIMNSNNSSNTVNIIYDSTATNSGYINVVAGMAAGGLVGRTYKYALNVTGASDKTTFYIKEILSKAVTPDENTLVYGANIESGIGGIIGASFGAKNEGSSVVTIHGTSSTPRVRKLSITNINITKYPGYGNISVTNNNNSNSAYRNFAGGFIGSCHDNYIILSNNSISDINVSANIAGGIIGIASQKFYIDASNISIDGNSTATITGTRAAGGFVGFANCRDFYWMLLDGIVVNAYNIVSSYTGTIADFYGAGGIIGVAKSDTQPDSSATAYVCEFNNIYIVDNTIKTNYSNANYNNNNALKAAGTGGMIGIIANGANQSNIFNMNSITDTSLKIKFGGYDIFLENNSIIHLSAGSSNDSATNQAIAEVVGNNLNLSAIRFIGVSILLENRSTIGKVVGKYGSNDNEYGVASVESGYGTGVVVFSDYSAVQTNTTSSNIRDNNDTFTNATAKNPYITVNPVFNLGTKTVTGDGFASSIASLALSDILSNNSENEIATLYSYITSKAYNGGVETNGSIIEGIYSRFSMFSSEVSSYSGPDFPVLVLEDRNTINKYINAYLRILTNTQYDYTYDLANAFSIAIYNMAYSNGTFTESLTGASLKRNDSGFYVNFNTFDSGKTQFSLIDVRFYNPAYPSEVAYHLYVPIFIKKVLSYDFEISAQSGTSYLDSKYSDKYGEALIENIGTPVTVFFKYTYSRSGSEWNEAVNAGENVYRSYAKTLLLTRANTSNQLSDFDSNTMLALVDPNNSGKVYYATLGNAVSNDGVIDLSAFRLPIYSNGALSLTGDYFSSVSLSELMDITVSSVGDNRIFVECAENEATVKTNNNYYRLATDDELANNSVEKVSLTVNGGENAVSEKYYLSIFTEIPAETNPFHYYLITCPTSFAETTYPSKMKNVNSANSMVHLVMGKIFYHNNFDLKSDSKMHSQIMNSTNNELTVNLQAEFGLRSDLETVIRNYMTRLIEVTPVYQSYLVYLNRNDGRSNTKAIIGSPSLSGTYSVDYTLNGQSDAQGVNYTNINRTASYVEFVTGDLKSYFASGNNFEIIASVTLAYQSNAIGSQFPGRNSNYPDNGVTISGSSNLAFLSTATSYSKNTILKDEQPAISYYSEEQPISAVLDLNPVGNKIGDFTSLGINPLNPGDLTVSSFELLAVLDTVAVRNVITDYSSAKIAFVLSQKVGDEYVKVDDITEYIYQIKIGGNAITAQEMLNGKEISKALLADNGVYITLPRLEFSVYTGSLLQSANHMYTNYRLDVVVSLLDELGGEVESSRASNYVIYTNAKVVPDFIIRKNN